MPAHFRNLSPDEQALVRQVEPFLGHSTPRTRRHMRRALGGWSNTKFWDVQHSLALKGWPIKPYGEKVKVRGHDRPLYRLLKEEEHFIRNGVAERRYNVSRTRTGRAVQTQGEKENPLSQPIFDEEQRLHVSNNVLRGERTPVPIGDSLNDPELKLNQNGDKVLSNADLAKLLAPMMKQHPKNR